MFLLRFVDIPFPSVPSRLRVKCPEPLSTHNTKVLSLWLWHSFVHLGTCPVKENFWTLRSSGFIRSGDKNKKTNKKTVNMVTVNELPLYFNRSDFNCSKILSLLASLEFLLTDLVSLEDCPCPLHYYSKSRLSHSLIPWSLSLYSPFLLSMTALSW